MLDPKVYAPIESGTTRQIVRSKGINNAPEWVDNDYQDIYVGAARSDILAYAETLERGVQKYVSIQEAANAPSTNLFIYCINRAGANIHVTAYDLTDGYVYTRSFVGNRWTNAWKKVSGEPSNWLCYVQTEDGFILNKPFGYLDYIANATNHLLANTYNGLKLLDGTQTFTLKQVKAFGMVAADGTFAYAENVVENAALPGYYNFSMYYEDGTKFTDCMYSAGQYIDADGNIQTTFPNGTA